MKTKNRLSYGVILQFFERKALMQNATA